MPAIPSPEHEPNSVALTDPGSVAPIDAPPDAAPAVCAAGVPKMRADARRNRERIVSAAREVFAERGEDAQMDDVAAAAGVGVGTVYRHFATKDAVIGELLRTKFELIAGNLESARDEVDDPGEALLLGMRRNAEAVADDLTVQHMLSGAQRPEAWVVAAPALNRLNTISQELIDGGKATGTLRDDLVVTDLRLLMCGISATMADAPIAHLWPRHLDLMVGALRALPSGHA